MKKIFRKIKHRRFIECHIAEMRWESLNVILVASSTQWSDDVEQLLNNNALLIRKYERRRRWLKF